MRVIITGGGGFLGSRLAKRILEIGYVSSSSGQLQPIDEIRLVDMGFQNTPSIVDDRVKQITGRIQDRDFVFSLFQGEKDISVFHLASMVSGECEERFDDALQVNMQGCLLLLDAVRQNAKQSRFIFASSIACFGGDSMRDPCDDHTKLTPLTTYGMTKAICELLINDYTRKGFIDGRSARLPTVIIRPGKPNTAASSWASGMFREPLKGEPCYLPVAKDQRHPMTGYRTVIESLIRIHELDSKPIGKDRSIGLPALQVTPQMAEEAILRLSLKHSFPLGPIVEQPDERIQRIVSNWPIAIDGRRGLALGLPNVSSLDQIILDYIHDFPAR